MLSPHPSLLLPATAAAAAATRSLRVPRTITPEHVVVYFTAGFYVYEPDRTMQVFYPYVTLVSFKANKFQDKYCVYFSHLLFNKGQK